MSDTLKAVTKALNKIGHANGTQFHEANYAAAGSSNDEAEAQFAKARALHELAVAQCVSSYAARRYDEAKKMARSVGLLGDFDNLEDGRTHRTGKALNGVVDVVVDRNGEVVKAEDLVLELRLLGVPKEKCDKAYAAATRVRKGNRKLVVTLL